MELNKYLEELEAQIRSKKARLMVIEEIKNHIEDQAGFYKNEGLSDEEAMKQAVKQMGDPVEVGIEMDRIHRPKPGGFLFLMAVIMSLAGLLAQYFGFYRFKDELLLYQRIIDNAFARQCIYVLIGAAVMLVIFYLDYSLVGRYGKKLGALLLVSLFVICFFAPVYNGSHSYMKSLIYLFVPIYGGILYQNRNRGYYGILSSLFWIAAAFWIGTAEIGGGLGITLDMACICYLMLTVTIFKGWFQEKGKAGAVLTAAIIPTSAVFIFFTHLRTYQLRRLEILFHPERYAQEAGYQAAKAREVISGLTMFGMGDGNLEQLPSRVLPGVQHDFILLQVASVYGILTAGLLIALLTVFLFCLFRMIFKQKNQLGKITGYGCVMVIGVEIARSLFNNFGFFTISTGGLPFFSYGRCHTIVIYVLLGVIFSIYRYQNLVWETDGRRKKLEKGVLAQLGKYRIRIERCGS